jgi:hypothetical protein
MTRAVLKDGKIQPLDPLPPDWREGEELKVERLEERDPTPEELDAWAKEMDALCADSDPEEDARLQAALDENRRMAKEWMRGYMGLANIVVTDVRPTE